MKKIVFFRCGALRFTVAKISLTAFPPSDISGLDRIKNVKFGTKVVSSTWMMHTLRFLGKKVF